MIANCVRTQFQFNFPETKKKNEILVDSENWRRTNEKNERNICRQCANIKRKETTDDGQYLNLHFALPFLTWANEKNWKSNKIQIVFIFFQIKIWSTKKMLEFQMCEMIIFFWLSLLKMWNFSIRKGELIENPRTKTVFS